jgi:hypothetical protein
VIFLVNVAIIVGATAAVWWLIVRPVIDSQRRLEQEILGLLRIGRLDADFLSRRIGNDRGTKPIARSRIRVALWLLERRGIVFRKEVGVSPGHKGRTFYWLVEKALNRRFRREEDVQQDLRLASGRHRQADGEPVPDPRRSDRSTLTRSRQEER